MTNIIYESCHHLLVIFLLGPIKWGPKSGGGGNHACASGLSRNTPTNITVIIISRLLYILTFDVGS